MKKKKLTYSEIADKVLKSLFITTFIVIIMIIFLPHFGSSSPPRPPFPFRTVVYCTALYFQPVRHGTGHPNGQGKARRTPLCSCSGGYHVPSPRPGAFAVYCHNKINRCGARVCVKCKTLHWCQQQGLGAVAAECVYVSPFRWVLLSASAIAEL